MGEQNFLPGDSQHSAQMGIGVVNAHLIHHACQKADISITTLTTTTMPSPEIYHHAITVTISISNTTPGLSLTTSSLILLLLAPGSSWQCCHIKDWRAVSSAVQITSRKLEPGEHKPRDTRSGPCVCVCPVHVRSLHAQVGLLPLLVGEFYTGSRPGHVTVAWESKDLPYH
ncbi:Immunoglobulin Lambda Constant 3 [Manis pentadactyla]|nr:Immunoglobulin Lambda Constant 3 [Manis pentadactyla]